MIYLLAEKVLLRFLKFFPQWRVGGFSVNVTRHVHIYLPGYLQPPTPREVYVAGMVRASARVFFLDYVTFSAGVVGF